MKPAHGNFNLNRVMLKDEWITPYYIIETLGPFDLDPCAAVEMPWKTATTMLTKEQDGLIQPWVGFVWCNPPYGKFTHLWLKRMKEHGNGILLMFARTDTKMFTEYVWNGASSILFLKGRISFCNIKGVGISNGNAPSVLVGYGSEATRRLLESNLKGSVVSWWEKKG